jgi:PEP-CTERM motif
LKRKVQLFLLLLLVAASTESGVQASTDCERWIATYKTQLEHAKAVKKIEAAHQRLKRAAQRKMAVYVKKPAPVRPRPFLVQVPKPKLTPEQVLERFNLLCGDLPGEPKTETFDRVIDGPPTPEFVSEMSPPFVPLLPTDTDTYDELIPPGVLTSYVPPGADGPGYPPTGGGGFTGPIFGGGGSGGKSGQVTTTSVGDTPPPGIVPEPSSVALMLTGVAAVAGAVRRRRRA